MGRTLSSMALQSSRAFPDLLVISITLVNIGKRSFRWTRKDERKVAHSARRPLAFLECHQPTLLLGECQLLGIGATVRCHSQALFFDVMALKADQHCSTSLL